MSDPEAAQLDAVVFDFDGTIFDSETPIFHASAATLAEMGHRLTIEGWATVVGLGEDESFAALERAVGSPIDRAEFEARYDAQDRSWRDQLPPLPGVERLTGELHAAGVGLAIASSSPSRWVDLHLARLGLADRFSVVATRDRVGGRAKPDPASYRFAVEGLGADPRRTVAIEDAAPGIAAAQAAGLTVAAVPSHITRHTDLSAADHHVDSLEHVSVAWLASLVAGPTRFSV